MVGSVKAPVASRPVNPLHELGATVSGHSKLLQSTSPDSKIKPQAVQNLSKRKLNVALRTN